MSGVEKRPSPVAGAHARIHHEDAGDDFSVRKVPFGAKRSARDFSVLSMGAVTSVFVFSLGGTMATSYGLAVTVITGIFGFVVASAACAVVAWHGSGTSMGVDPMSRGAGFGFVGSGINVLAYGITWIAYAAFECSFIASAIHATWSAPPMWVLHLVVALVLVPLTWYGVSQIAWLQWATVPLFFIGAVYLIIQAIQQPPSSTLPTGITLPALVQATAIPLFVVPILSLALGDYGRFIKKADRRRAAPMGAMLMMGLWLLELIAGAFITSRTGSLNPGSYSVQLMGFAGMVWVVVTQLKCQFANYYGASLALANFSTRILKRAWGRRVFLVVTGFAAFFLSLFDVIDNLTYIAGLLGVVLTAWLSLLMTDFFLRRKGRARFGADWVEHRRTYLASWGWPEVLSMAGVSTLGVVLVVADAPRDYSSVLALVLGWILPPPVAWLVRKVVPSWSGYLVDMPGPEWRDTAGRTDENSESPACKRVCSSCGNHTSLFDAVPVPAGQNTRVHCSECDAVA